MFLIVHTPVLDFILDAVSQWACGVNLRRQRRFAEYWKKKKKLLYVKIMIKILSLIAPIPPLPFFYMLYIMSTTP
jgi:hypothetical protein